MKQVIAVMCVAILILFIIGCEGCEKSEEVRALEKKQQAERNQRYVNKLVGKIRYIKDLRTNLCFAYYWGGDGPALTIVPCDSIPPELLTVAK